MYRLKAQLNAAKAAVPLKPILAARRRRQLYPFLFSMGPVALSICSVLLIGLMAVLYLTEVGQAVAANQQLQDLQAQQTTLQRQNQDLVNVIAQEQSPDYITEHAKSLGLVPADPKIIQTIVIKNLEPIRHDNINIRP
jgi:cell division protein FtsL